MKLNIIEYPDKRLKLKSKEVKNFDKRLHLLLDDMYSIMINTNGIGLAAIQVAHPIRAFIVNIPNEEDCLLYTSPSPRDPHVSRMPSSA